MLHPPSHPLKKTKTKTTTRIATTVQPRNAEFALQQYKLEIRKSGTKGKIYTSFSVSSGGGFVATLKNPGDRHRREEEGGGVGGDCNTAGIDRCILKECRIERIRMSITFQWLMNNAAFACNRTWNVQKLEVKINNLSFVVSQNFSRVVSYTGFGCQTWNNEYMPRPYD